MNILRRLVPEKYRLLVPLLIVGGMFGCSLLNQHWFDTAWILLTFLGTVFVVTQVLAPKLLPIENTAEQRGLARLIFTEFLTGSHPRLTLVRNGRVVKSSDQPGDSVDDEDLYSYRGIIVGDSTSVIVLNTETGISRVIGPGIGGDDNKSVSGVAFTYGDEWIDTIIDLRPQLRTELIEAHTREGIPVTVRVTAFFTLKGTRARRMIDLAHEQARTRWPHPFGWRQASAYEAVHSKRIERKGDKDERTEWSDRVMAIAIPQLRRLIAQYSLDYLTAPLGAERHPRFAIRNELIKIVQRELDASDEFKRGAGIEVHFMAVGIMWPQDKVIEQRIRSWQESWHKRETEIMGQAEADAVLTHEQARAQAQGEMIARINDVLKEAADSGTLSADLVALRFLEAMEKMAKDPTTRTLLTLDSLDILKQLRDMLKPDRSEATS